MTMRPDLWYLVRDGSKDTATHALLAAAIKHSPLLAEFWIMSCGSNFAPLR